MRRRLVLLIFLIAVTAGVYTQRVPISALIADWQTPALPEPVTYQQVMEQTQEPTEPVPVLEDEDVPEDTPTEEVVPLPVTPDASDDVMEHPQEAQEPVTEDEATADEEEGLDPLDVLPANVNLAVPFTSQAPHGIWAEPYKESCEEASIYMVHAYYQGEPAGQILKDVADRALVDLVAFENELFGYYEDTTAEQTGLLAEMVYGYSWEVLENPTELTLKTHLAQGRPIVFPAAGRLLGNPYFTAPGPVYHMLVVRGYTDDGFFIVNDPGTSRGEAYLYDVDTLMSAMHDWNHGNEITQGARVVLVLTP